MKIRAMMCLLLLTAGSAMASGSTYSAGDVLSDCESKKAIEQAYCVTYLAGIQDAHNVLVFWKNLQQPKFCTPGRVSPDQLRNAFTRYANENSQDLHLAAASMVMNAFYHAFPCK